MVCGEKPNVDLGSMDLYSRVKLRALTREARAAKKNDFPAVDEKFANARLRKYKSNVRKRRSLASIINVEKQARGNAIAVKTSRLKSLVEVSVEEIDEFNNSRKGLSIQRNNVCDSDYSNHFLDEGTAIEMLGQLSAWRTENRYNGFEIGDLVWGKIMSYPWWPGQIYNEALASPSVKSTKKEGSVLVAFFGDYTYAWVDPRHLIPFDIHYAGKSRQTNYPAFEEAVEEAMREFKRKAVLGLICHCQNPSKFLPIKVRGLFEVDFNGFFPGGLYSAEQIKKARDDFQPEETLAFLKQMALTPRNFASDNLFLLKNMLKVHFYQRKTRCSFKSFVQVNQVQQKSCQIPKSSTVDKAALLGALEAKAREIQVSKQDTEANDQHEDDIFGQKHRLSFNCGRLSHKGSGDHKMQISSNKSNCIVSKVSQFETPHKQIESYGAFKAGKKRNISGLPEYSSFEKPVRQKNMKDLMEISDNQKYSELHGEKGTGIETRSSIKLEKESVIDSNSMGSKVEPDQPLMLVLNFPSGVILPSVLELKDKFMPFGLLQESSISVLWESSRCQILFHRVTDAAEAYLHAIQNRSLFSSPVRYDLQMVGVACSMLPEISKCYTPSIGQCSMEIQPDKSLSRVDYYSESKLTVDQLLSPDKFKTEPFVEGPSIVSVSTIPFLESTSCQSYTPPVEEGHMEIQPERFFSKAECFNDLNPTVPRFLLPEEIKTDLIVEEPRFASGYEIQFLGSDSCDSQNLQHTIPVAAQQTSLCHTPQLFSFSQILDEFDKKYGQLEAVMNTDSHTTHTSASTSDNEKNKFINPLYSNSDVLDEIKPFI